MPGSLPRSVRPLDMPGTWTVTDNGHAVPCSVRNPAEGGMHVDTEPIRDMQGCLQSSVRLLDMLGTQSVTYDVHSLLGRAVHVDSMIGRDMRDCMQCSPQSHVQFDAGDRLLAQVASIRELAEHRASTSECRRARESIQVMPGRLRPF